MKKTKLLAVLLLVSLANLIAQKPTAPITINSKIDKVTVFLKGAQVQRLGEIQIPSGRSEIIFKGLSPNIDKQSIQVKGDGAFSIMSVNHQINHLEEQLKREEISKLDDAKYRLNDAKKRKSAQLAIYKKEEAILEKNQAVAGQQNGISASELVQVVDFQRKRFTELTMQQLDLTNELAQLDSTLYKLDKQQKVLNNKKELVTSEVIVTVSAKSGTNAKFELAYYVLEAGWFATYDLRVKDVVSPISLAFKANVRQNTGEDWKDVNLTISSGDPTSNSVSQELFPWKLKFGYPTYPPSQPTAQAQIGRGGISEVSGKIFDGSTGEALIGATILVKGTSIGTITDVDGHFSLNVPSTPSSLEVSYTGYNTKAFPVNSNSMNISLEPSTQALSEVVVTGYASKSLSMPSIKFQKRTREDKTIPLEMVESYEPTTVNFKIETPYTIFSDGKNYMVDIKTNEVTAAYQYFATPKLDENAYLMAQISDWQELNLMSGEVNLFYEGGYLGRSLIDTKNTSDTLEISLGADKGVAIKRSKVRETSIRQSIGANKIERRVFEIVVKNNKQVPIQLTLQDQFPISTNKDIEVNDQSFEEGAYLDKDTQILTWKFDLAPKAERKLSLKYSVKYPKRQVLQLE